MYVGLGTQQQLPLGLNLIVICYKTLGTNPSDPSDIQVNKVMNGLKWNDFVKPLCTSGFYN